MGWAGQEGCLKVGYSPAMSCGISVLAVGIMSPLLPPKPMQEGHFELQDLNYNHFL